MRTSEELKSFAEQAPCLCFQLRKASRAITQVYDHMLRDIGLTACQMMILNTLHEMTHLTVTELAEAMATDRTTITRNLKPLERKEYVCIQKGKDKRSRDIHLTPAGEKVMIQAGPIFQSFQKKLHQEIGNAELQSLCEDLRLTISKIQQFSV